MKILERQNGTISRTKKLNAVTLGAAVVGAILPALEVYVAPEVYSAGLGLFALINQYLRDSQSIL